MQNNSEKREKVKVAIKNLVVAFTFVIMIFIIGSILFGKQISMAIKLVKNISIKQSDEIETEPIQLIQNKLASYPKYGEKYGTLEIADLNVNLNLYYGDTLSILRNGVGHTAGSYFPGEGGSIICMAHNTEGFLKELSKIKKGANITIQTEYGKFVYEVYDTKIVNQENLDAVPLQKEKEILMLYTCYPTNTFGHAKQRFITYSKLVECDIF
ncbi:MAG: class D sortase [Clostridia bacterium]|nr:class D sortase [Clostridia bacterium]